MDNETRVPMNKKNSKDGFAIASFVLSLVSIILCFTFLPQVIAIVLGFLGLKSSKKGLAISGLIISFITGLLAIGLVAAIAIPNIMVNIENARAMTDPEIGSIATKATESTKTKTSSTPKETSKTEKPKKSEPLELEPYYSSDKGIVFYYNPNKWKELKLDNTQTNHIGISLNDDQNFNATLSCIVYKETLTEEKYIEVLKESNMKNMNVDYIDITNVTFNNRDYTQFRIEQDNFIRYIIIIYNGIEQYEIYFDVARQYEDQGLHALNEVLSSLELLKEPSGQVIDNPELAEAMDLLNQAAGNDYESVLQNISSDGSELIGHWEYGTTSNGLVTISALVLFEDGTYKRYKSYPDESSIIIGNWEYKGKGHLFLTLTKGLDNGSDITDKLNLESNYLIQSFKDGEMKTMNALSLNEVSYKKKK